MAADRREPERRPGGAASASETTRAEGRSNGAPRRPGGARQASSGTRTARPSVAGPKAARSAAAKSGAANKADRATDARDARGRSAGQRLRIVAGALAAVVLLLCSGALGYLNWRFGQIERLDLDLPAAMAGGPQNYLIVGSDTRAGITSDDPNAGAYLNDEQYAANPDGAGQRSDSIMVLRIDPRDTTARLLSLPRDLYVPIAGSDRSDRINAAFAEGPKVLIQTIQDNFGIVINHYVEVDFVGFQALIDAIGGVPIYFDTPMWDGHTGLNVTRRGCQTLDGVQALAFARSRYLWYYTGDLDEVDTTSLPYLTDSQMQANGWTYDGTSDLGRISRQQMLARTLIPLAKSKAFRNPATLNAVVGSLVDNVSLDKGLSASNIAGLARRFESFDSDHLKTYSYPSTRAFVGGADVQKPDEAQAAPILALFRDAPAVPESLVTVEVLNASGVDGQAANVAGALQRVGFSVLPTANASTIGIDHLERSQVRYAPGDEESAHLVASHLTEEPELAPIAGMSSGTIVVVTGEGFDKVTTDTRPAPTTTTTEPSASAPSTTVPETTTTVIGKVPDAERSC